MTDGTVPTVHDRRERRGFSSRLVGVHWCASLERWIARCKRKYLGSFSTEGEAGTDVLQSPAQFTLTVCFAY